MSKKGLFTGLLALLLVFALLGCKPMTDSDQWTKVTSLDGLDGTWKGLVRNSQTMPGAGTDTISLTTSTETKIIIPRSGDVSTTIITDFSEFIKVSAETQNKKEQEIWEKVKEDFPPETGFIFSEKAPYTGTKTFNTPRDAFEKNLVTAGVTVNQSKTRIKTEVVYNDPEIPTKDTENYPSGMKPIETDDEWKKFQEEFVKEQGVFSGDMTVTFSAGAPYTMTTTQIYHKQ